MSEKGNYWLSEEGLALRAAEFARFLTVRTFNNALQMFAADGGVKGFLYRTMLDDRVCELCSPYERRYYRAGQFMKFLPQHFFCRCGYDILVEEYTWGIF